jgi:uncharacterized membrane protein YdjX (TVP38/TMEM64 family)
VSDGGGGRKGGGTAWAKLALLVALVAAGLLAARLTSLGDYLSREGVGATIGALRDAPAAPLVFVGVYAAATAIAIPGTILTLAGGALFGVLQGTIYNSIAANLGANAAFLIARFLGRDAVEGVTGDRLARLDRATRDHGFRGLLTLRLVPLVPFNALNFGSGLTAISWSSYALATVIGILPGTIVYTMFADALLAGSREASREAFVRVAVSGVLLVLLSFLPTLLKKMNVKLPGAALLALAVLVPGGAVGREAPRQGAPPDPRDFTTVLEGVVEGDRVDYERLQRQREGLDAYLERLAAVDPAVLATAPAEARLAFWINAYNACMMRLVSDHYPIEKASGLLDRLKNTVAGRPVNSVWQIDDVFGREHCEVAGEPRSQDEIEHEIIRPMGDPRIHFAINCAAVSCPSLAREAYTAEALDRQLDRQVRRFVDDPRHLTVERTDDGPVLRLNEVLDWFGEDFGGVDGVVSFLAPYLEGDERAAVADPSLQVRFFDYDWTLNDIERGRHRTPSRP